MKYKRTYLVVFAKLSFIALFSFAPPNEQKVKFIIPKGWPKPVYDFSRNKITEEGFKLGRALFFDPILSKDSSISCMSCHLQFSGFTHGDHSLSHGINGVKGTRNSATLFNLAWSTSFMWDGGVNNIEVQPINPITSPLEMGSDLKEVLLKLNRSARYRKLFYDAFKDSLPSSKHLLKSLAQFTLMFQSYNSVYDKVMRNEKGIAFSEQEQNGYLLFKKNCTSCHTEPLFTSGAFKNNGMPLDSELNDYGRMKITQDPADSLKFKVPSLRNISVSGPYMHDGRFRKLADVIEHYSEGIVKSKTLAAELPQPIHFSPVQKQELLAFLNTLTDKDFLYDLRFRNYFYP